MALCSNCNQEQKVCVSFMTGIVCKECVEVACNALTWQLNTKLSGGPCIFDRIRAACKIDPLQLLFGKISILVKQDEMLEVDYDQQGTITEARIYKRKTYA